jgi:hypothetical protein
VPIRYERDDTRRRVVVTLEGQFQTDDILASLERNRSEDTWTYGVLYDLRLVTGHPTIADLRQIMNAAATRPRGEGARGPLALLATDPDLYGRMCTYAALQKSTTVEVFRALDDADQWLTARLLG